MIFGRHINKYYLKYWYFFLLGIIALIAVDYYQLLIPEIYGKIIDGLGGNIPLNLDILSSYIIQMASILLILVFGRFLWRICFFGTAVRIEADLRSRMFNYSKDLSQQFYQTHKTGALMALYTNDLSTVRMCFGNGILMAVDAIFLGVMTFVKMYRLNQTLALACLIPLAFIAIASGLVGKIMNRKWRRRQEAFEQMSDYTQESFSGISVIRAFVKESKEIIGFKKINKDNVDRNVEFVKSATLLQVLLGLFMSSITIVIIGFGGYIVYTKPDMFSVGKLNEFIGYFGTITWPMMAISRLINMTSQAQASYKRIEALLEEKLDVFDKDVEAIESPKGEIEFKNLSFTYPNTKNEVLHNISFKIEAGSHIGIIGKTGCGKTTLVDLLLRIYNLEEGTCFIDNNDIMHTPIKQVRDIISYVPQDNFLFSEKIRNNIAFAFKTSSIEDVIEYAKLADIHDNIVDFKEGYDTILGERGVTVSGGQKQRISIARALMKNSEILILDDSVSAVDTKTEEKILSNLKEVRKNKTTILIAHRISTVKDLDKILLIDDGKVLAYGSHSELLQTSSEYKEMVESQKLEDEVGGKCE